VCARKVWVWPCRVPSRCTSRCAFLACLPRCAFPTCLPRCAIPTCLPRCALLVYLHDVLSQMCLPGMPSRYALPVCLPDVPSQMCLLSVPSQCAFSMCLPRCAFPGWACRVSCSHKESVPKGRVDSQGVGGSACACPLSIFSQASSRVFFRRRAKRR